MAQRRQGKATWLRDNAAGTHQSMEMFVVPMNRLPPPPQQLQQQPLPQQDPAPQQQQQQQQRPALLQPQQRQRQPRRPLRTNTQQPQQPGIADFFHRVPPTAATTPTDPAATANPWSSTDPWSTTTNSVELRHLLTEIHSHLKVRRDCHNNNNQLAPESGSSHVDM